MTCKISFIKSIRETLKHHLASIFSVCLVFFIQLIIFFLEIQNYASDQYNESLDKEYILERLNEMTLPNFGYVVPIVLIAILLAFDFFRYMHSKKQIDFYESLPIRRKDSFLLRITAAVLIFMIPYFICSALQAVLLIIFGFFTPSLLGNLLWNFTCMVLIFMITFLTGTLAMIMTGHPVIAFFGFCVFSAYAPILLRYIYPAYADEYFHTYLTDDTKLHYLNYLSPIGLAYKLVNTNYYDWNASEHTIDFIAIIIMIVLVGVLTYVLFQKRPSEAAGRAMTFTKCNCIIRILLVVPMTLYIGLYLSQVASIGAEIWMIFGFVISTILLHGIIESIFQFDIRRLWSHKKQMFACMITSLGIAFIFWIDLFGYNKYLPKLEDLESISINTTGHYTYSESTENDGISGEYLDDAYRLAQNLIEQDVRVDDESSEIILVDDMAYSSATNPVSTHEWISFEYHLKNGTVKKRQYYMDLNANKELFDKLYATKEYKNDICSLYRADLSNISYIEWSDGIYEVALHLTNAEMDVLFETYIAEYTPLTYSQVRSESEIGYFTIYHEDDLNYRSYSCPVYPHFAQTISLLEKYMLNYESTKDYGSLSESPLSKYTINSIEIYMENAPITIVDTAKIESVKDEMILTDSFYKKNSTIDWTLYYDVRVSLATPNGIAYTSVILPREIVDELIK